MFRSFRHSLSVSSNFALSEAKDGCTSDLAGILSLYADDRGMVAGEINEAGEWVVTITLPLPVKAGRSGREDRDAFSHRHWDAGRFSGSSAEAHAGVGYRRSSSSRLPPTGEWRSIAACVSCTATLTSDSAQGNHPLVPSGAADLL